MLEIEKGDINSYFDKNILIEDDHYNSIKSIIQCKYCNKILKEPMMCKECLGAFCKNCIDELGKNNHKCESPVYVENTNAKALLGTLKYLCKNCKSEVKGSDIENHLKEGCEKNENPSKLMDCIFRKKSLTKLKQEEIKKLEDKKTNMYHISSKIFIFIIFSTLVILLGRANVGKSSISLLCSHFYFF